MEKVYLLYQNDAYSWSGHSWVEKVFRTKEAAEKYISTVYGHPVEPHQEVLYSDENSAIGFEIREMNLE
jgi:hypothetical protein